MKHVIVVRALGLATFMASVSCSPSGSPHSLKGINLENAIQDRFCVTLWPKKTRVHIGEDFDVTLRVVNATDKLQSFRILSCSWDAHWEINNPRIVLSGGISSICVCNSIVTNRLEPGESYEKHVQMSIRDGPPRLITSFRMGFTPIGEKKTYWSNRVVLGIKPRGKEEKRVRVEEEKGEEKPRHSGLGIQKGTGSVDIEDQ